MSQIALDSHLDLLEQRLAMLAASLIDGETDTLVSSSASLQQLAIELAQFGEVPVKFGAKGMPDRVLRIKGLVGGLASIRENLLRQAAFVDRALETVVPATQQKSTYSSNRTYGGPVRQSGAFTVLAA